MRAQTSPHWMSAFRPRSQSILKGLVWTSTCVPSLNACLLTKTRDSIWTGSPTSKTSSTSDDDHHAICAWVIFANGLLLICDEVSGCSCALEDWESDGKNKGLQLIVGLSFKCKFYYNFNSSYRPVFLCRLQKFRLKPLPPAIKTKTRTRNTFKLTYFIWHNLFWINSIHYIRLL